MKTLNENVAAFYQWRKKVLMVTPLDIVLILLMIGLFTATFIVSFTSTKGPEAVAALKRYLQSLSSALQQVQGIDTETERSKMEAFINGVKVSCDAAVISNDMELRSILVATHKQICLASVNKSDGERTGWIKLKAASRSFGAGYFSLFSNET